MRKKFLAVVLAAALACNMTGMTAAAQPAVAGLSVLKGLFGQDKGGEDTKTDEKDESGKDSSKETGSAQGASGKKEADNVTLDIGQSDIIISKNGVRAVDTSGSPVTETSSQYVITGSTQEHAIVVEDGVNANIVLSNVNITRTMDGVSPLRIADDSKGTVQVLLEGDNILQGGPGAAGIQKNCMHTDGACSCGTLVINCANTKNGHICDASCGTLTATGSSGAAGIGGGTGMGSAKISVKGGMVTANGGVGGASGGLGTKVTIAGGMVKAGSLNGKAGSGANLMNGNTLVFADSTADLQTSKGILYQNGAGTVYGNVELSQGLADYLPTDSTLTIPEKSSLTIDESTTLPNEGNIVGVERLIRKKSKTPTPTPEVTEESQQEMALAEETQQEPQARDMVQGTSTITLHILKDGQQADNSEVAYGSSITLEATVNRMDNQSQNSTGTQEINGRVEFFYRGASIGVQELESSSGAATAQRSLELAVSRMTNLTMGQNTFTATYTGNASYGTPDPATATINVVPADLSPIDYVLEESVIAGLKLKDALPVKDITLRPENAIKEKVEGTWNWGSDGEKTIWPSTTEQAESYTCNFEFADKADEERYKPYSITFSPTITMPYVSASVNETLRVRAADESKRYDGWYNIASGDIKASLPGYTLLEKFPFEDDFPVSRDEWSNSKWEAEIVIKVENNYNNGNFPIYVRNTSTGEIRQAVIEDFKVDKNYPLIDSYNCRRSGTVAYLTFGAGNESGESGVKRYTCEVQQRRNNQGVIVDPLDIDTVRKSTHVADEDPGTINFVRLSSESEHDVYVLVMDNAGNETHYMTRIIKADGSSIGEAGAAVNANDPQERYGYDFQTDKPDIAGTVTLTVTDSEGNEKLGEVAYLDRITAAAHPTVGNTGDLTYRWYRQLPTSVNPDPIVEAANSPTYDVQAADIGYHIVCRVYGANTSSESFIAKDVGPVIKGICPYVPTNGRVDDGKDTFTFDGIYRDETGIIKYEYCTDGGKSDTWTAVDDSGGLNTFVINVGDKTILAGDLLVRAAESDLYRPSDTLANEQNFISTGELEITFEGEARYGEVLTAQINSDAIDPSDITYEWSHVNGSAIDNYGNSYELKKEDIDTRIQVKAVLRDFEEINNTAVSEPVRKREVNAVINVADKEYDGTTEADATVSFTGLMTGDDLSSSIDVEFVDKNAGENKSMKVGKSGAVTGEDVKCYIVRWPDNSDVKGTIRPRQLTLNMTAENKVYDGTVDAVVNFTATALAGDSIEVSGTGEFADKNVGKNKTVTSKDVIVTGADAANYTAIGSTATATASITKRDISIEGITVADKEFDNTTDAVIAVTFAGAMDEVSYTYEASFESATVGMDKRVTAKVALSGSSAENYNLANGEITGTGNIIKAPAPYEESTIPQNLTGVEGKKLSSVYIGAGFSWKEPNTVMENVGRHTYDALYNPDPTKYGSRQVRIEVLVQCAKHTWGDWSTTAEPAKTELGQRQRICSVCGYIETETIPRAPYITTEDTKVGWGDIIQAINNASSGTEIPVTMNGTESLPASVQEALQGRDVSLVLQMTDGITWTLRGQDITGSVLKDINLAVTLYTDNIPTDVLDPYLEGGKTAVQIHLAYSGEFGFTATLRVPLANEFAGVNSTFYYYNPNRERLEQMDTNRITSDGIGRYDLTHASDYVVILDGQNGGGGGSVSENSPTPQPQPSGDSNSDNNNPNNNNPNNGGGSTGSGTTPSANRTATATATAAATGAAATGTAAATTSGNTRLISINAVKTGDETPVMSYVILLLLGAAGGTAVVTYRRIRRKERS